MPIPTILLLIVLILLMIFFYTQDNKERQVRQTLFVICFTIVGGVASDIVSEYALSYWSKC